MDLANGGDDGENGDNRPINLRELRGESIKHFDMTI